MGRSGQIRGLGDGLAMGWLVRAGHVSAITLRFLADSGTLCRDGQGGNGGGVRKHVADRIPPRIFLGPHSSGPIRHRMKNDLMSCLVRMSQPKTQEPQPTADLAARQKHLVGAGAV